jgi:hypothetical protein
LRSTVDSTTTATGPACSGARRGSLDADDPRVLHGGGTEGEEVDRNAAVAAEEEGASGIAAAVGVEDDLRGVPASAAARAPARSVAEPSTVRDSKAVVRPNEAQATDVAAERVATSRATMSSASLGWSDSAGPGTAVEADRSIEVDADRSRERPGV